MLELTHSDIVFAQELGATADQTRLAEFERMVRRLTMDWKPQKSLAVPESSLEDKREVIKILNSDYPISLPRDLPAVSQGLRYAYTDYTARLQSVGAQISLAEVGQSASQNLCRTSHSNDQGRRSLPERLSRAGGCSRMDRTLRR